VDNFIFSLNVVLPLVLLMLIGVFLRKIKIFDEFFLNKLSIFIFKVSMPFLLFNNIYTGKISDTVDPYFVILALILVLGTIGILIMVIPKYVKENRNRGVLIQGLYRSNFILFGIPLSVNIFGDEGLAAVTTLVAIIIPVYNFAAVIVLDLFTDHRQNYKETAVSILKNPLIIGTVLGILTSVFQIKLPAVLDKTIADIAKTATPMALMALGGEIEINNIWKNIKYLILVSAGKLFIIPAVTIMIAFFLGYRGAELCAFLCMMAPSTAVSSYTMAQQYDCNHELAGQIVFFTTIISPFSIFLFVFMLKTTGLF